MRFLLLIVDAKGTKRSFAEWPFNKVFFKNILLYVNARPSNIRSFHTHVEL